jgi:hypothetical protein
MRSGFLDIAGNNSGNMVGIWASSDFKVARDYSSWHGSQGLLEFVCDWVVLDVWSHKCKRKPNTNPGRPQYCMENAALQRVDALYVSFRPANAAGGRRANPPWRAPLSVEPRANPPWRAPVPVEPSFAPGGGVWC